MVRTTNVDDQPESRSFAAVDGDHHSVSVRMVTVASSVATDKHEDLVTPAECGAMAEREAKRRRVEWKGEGEAELVGVRSAEGELIGKDVVEEESQYATLRGQVGLGQTQVRTQLVLGDEWAVFDESGPSSVDEVALARQVSSPVYRALTSRALLTEALSTCRTKF